MPFLCQHPVTDFLHPILAHICPLQALSHLLVPFIRISGQRGPQNLARALFSRAPHDHLHRVRDDPEEKGRVAVEARVAPPWVYGRYDDRRRWSEAGSEGACEEDVEDWVE